MTPDISIIISVFNMEKYLGATLESLLLQDHASFEAVIVDDHSTDGTRRIAEKYASVDGRIRLFTNENIKGTGGSKNTGLAHMRGKACFFLDADDLLYPGALSRLYSLMEQTNALMVRGVASAFCHQRWLFLSNLEDMPEDTAVIQSGTFPTTGFWSHLYNSDFLKKNAIVFPEHLPIGQDGPFLCHAYSLADSIPFINRRVLLYRINHKRAAPTGAKSLAAINYFLLAREYFDREEKHHWVAPYLECKFKHQWLERVHAALEDGEDTAFSFMDGCANLFHGMEREVRPFLDAQLGAASEAFWNACREKDAPGMLAAVKNVAELKPQTPYMGIDRHPEGPGWVWYKTSRRLAGLLRDPETLKTLLTIRNLRKHSAARLTRNVA